MVCTLPFTHSTLAPAAPWVLAPAHTAASRTYRYGASRGCTGTLWVHVLCLKGFTLGFLQGWLPLTHLSRSMERAGGASASTVWSVLGFMSVN